MCLNNNNKIINYGLWMNTKYKYLDFILHTRIKWANIYNMHEYINRLCALCILEIRLYNSEDMKKRICTMDVSSRKISIV